MKIGNAIKICHDFFNPLQIIRKIDYTNNTR